MGAGRRKPVKQSNKKKKTKHKLGSALGAVPAHRGYTLKPQRMREKKNVEDSSKMKHGKIQSHGASFLNTQMNADSEYAGLTARLAAKVSQDTSRKMRMPRPIFAPATFSLQPEQSGQVQGSFSIDDMLGKEHPVVLCSQERTPKLSRKPMMTPDMDEGSHEANRFALLQENDPAAHKPMSFAPPSFQLQPSTLSCAAHSNNDDDDDEL